MPMTQPTERDPLLWCALISLLFAMLVGYQLGIPGEMYFDEVHYVPAARALLALQLANAEHPLVAKEAIAAAIGIFGDRPLAWRLPSALMGSIGLFAFGRALWWGSQSRFAALAGMVLLATDFAWFVQSRIAMLDMVMAGFAMVALWQVAAAIRMPRHGRSRLALAGIAMGLALGAKWSVAPVAILLVLALVGARIRAARPRPLEVTETPPIAGLSLIEIVFWLTSVPLATYWLTFMPAFFYPTNPLSPLGIVPWHHYMLQLQNSVMTKHPYQSVWYQWVGNWRAIWYLYEKVDGAQRGIVLIGNPYTMLAGLPAALWCLWAGLRGRWDALLTVGFYIGCLALWVFSGKPVQFYYHYLLPSSFLMAGLALALDALWRRQDALRWAAPGTLAVSAALFGYFYPIISGAPLHHGVSSFEQWMWLNSWR
jgi:dolichyl-phosphate-mannose-protein mannosyltransferase